MANTAFEELGILKKELINGKERTTEKFVRRVMRAIDNHEWVYMPIMENNRLFVCDDHGKLFVALYSGQDSKKIAPDMVCTDINKVIDAIYNDKNLSGIVFDLEDGPIFIPRGQISSLSSREDPRLQKRDWGSGIPDYTDEDLMTKDELFNFGLQTLLGILEKEGYEIVDYIDNYRAIPNIRVAKDNKLYVIYMNVGVALESEEIDPETIKNLKKIVENGTPMIANVFFGSTDPERFEAKLALVGDGFYCKYTGLENV